MKTGITTGPYIGVEGLERGLEHMRRHGYRHLDYNDLCNVYGALYACGENEFERRMADTARAAHAAGVQIGQIHGPWRYPPRDGDEADRREWFGFMCRALRGARLLGSGYMVVHPLMPFGVGEQEHARDEFFAINRDFFARLCAEAEREGVVVCLENMPFPQLPMTTPADVLAFVKELNSPWLRVCLDTGHSMVCGVQPADAVRQLGAEYLRVLHVHDNDGRNDLHLVPGMGVIGWDEFADALGEVGYGGTLSIETKLRSDMPGHVREHMRQGLAMMAQYLAERASGNA